MVPITLIALPLLACVLVYRYVVHPIFLSPLAAFPAAHPTASFSGMWMLWRRWKRTECSTIYEAHRRHGPIVRLGPGELHVNTLTDGVRTIYTGGFDRTSWYANFEHFGVPNLVSTRARAPHSARKRLITNVYSKSYLHNSPDLVASTTHLIQQQLLPRLAATAASPTPNVEVLELTAAFALDMMSAYLFGGRAGPSFASQLEFRRVWLAAYQSTKQAIFWIAEIPVVTGLLCQLGFNPIRAPMAGQKFLEDWALERCAMAEAALDAEKGFTNLDPSTVADAAPPTQPLVYKHLRNGLEPHADSLGHSLTLAVGSEMLDHMIAGHELSAITMCFLTWEMSRQPDLQARLRSELLSIDRGLVLATPPTPQEPMPSPRALDSLPLLDAVVRETLRRWSGGPGSQPRSVPTGGCQLGGRFVPEGTRVSASAFCLHRNESVFPEPNVWRPERWLSEGEERKEMERWFWPFSSGGRMCVGNHFAIHGLKLFVGAIYANFTTEVVDPIVMQQEDCFIAQPVPAHCILKFTRIEESAVLPSDLTMDRRDEKIENGTRV